MNDNEWLGKKITIQGDVQYIGDDEDPKDDPLFQCWEKSLKEFHQKITDELAKDDPNSGNWLK